MTGYTVHTGSNDKFRDGWENIFGGQKKQSSGTSPKESTKKTNTEKKSVTKAATKKKPAVKKKKSKNK